MRRERGFAVVLVLWAAMLLALMAASVLRTGQGEYRLARNRIAAAQMQGLAQAAVNLAILRLLATTGAPPPVDGTAFALPVAGRLARLRIQDAAGLIDLNFASEALLRRLLRASGAGPGRAARLAARILDWRESGAGRAPGGAKTEDYAAGGLDHGPREGPFRSVAELRLVLGMPARVAAKMAPLLTVHAQSPAIDPELAPAAVLRMLDLPTAPALPPGAVKIGHVFTIEATLHGPRGARVRRTEVVRLTGYRAAAIWIYP